MINDKMRILKMLEDGKITPTEAERLLKSVDVASSPNAGSPYSSSSESTSSTTSSTTSKSSSESSYAYNREYDREDSPQPNGPQRSNNNGSQRTESRSDGSGFAEDIGRRMDAFARDFEPRVRAFAEKVSESASRTVDKLGIGYKDPREGYSKPAEPYASRPRPAAPTQKATPAAAPRPKPTRPSTGASGETIELKVPTGGNELVLRTFNAPVSIKGYNGDRISARIIASPKRAGARVELQNLGGKFYLDYNENDFDRVGIDGFIPEMLFGYINIIANGGSLSLSTLAIEGAAVYASNCSTVDIKDISASELTIDADNSGIVTLNGLSGDSVRVENISGDISAARLDVAKFRAVTSNGSLSVAASDFSLYNDYYWYLEGGSGKLSLMVPAGTTAGYHIKARSALGKISVGLPGVSFVKNTRQLVEAKSNGLETKLKKVRIEAETSDAPLIIM